MGGVAGFEAEMRSCDAARRSWYASALRGAGEMSAIGSVALDELRAERDEVRADEGGGAQALLVAHRIENYFGWPAFEGVYLSPGGAPVALHAWNVLPDMSVLDACADRFGEGHGVRAVAPGSPGWGRFRREWAAHYNPSMADRHPELAGCLWTGRDDMATMAAAARRGGDAWWLPGGVATEALEAFRARMAELRGDAAPAAGGPMPGRG